MGAKVDKSAIVPIGSLLALSAIATLDSQSTAVSVFGLIAYVSLVFSLSNLLIEMISPKLDRGIRLVLAAVFGLGLAILSIYITAGVGLLLDLTPIRKFPILAAWYLITCTILFTYHQLSISTGATTNSSIEFDFRIILLSLLTVLLVCLGAYFRNYHSIIWFNYISISSIVLLIGSLFIKSWRPAEYCIGIFAAALGLIWSHQLMTSYVVGADIRLTIYYTSRIIESGVWDPSVSGRSPLTTETAVPASVSILTGIDLHLYYKILHPILIAISPVGVYLTARQRFDEKPALIAALAYATFFRTILGNPAKQHLAELILVALFLLWITDVPIRTKRILGIVFGFMLVQTHYSTLFVFLPGLLLASLAITIWQRDRNELKGLSLNYLLILSLLAALWYMWVAAGEKIRVAILAINSIINIAISVLVGDPIVQDRTVAGVATSATMPLDIFHTLLYVSFVGLIGIGLLRTGCRLLKGKSVISTQYDLVSGYLFGWVIIATVAEAQLGADRIIDMALVTLSTFFAYGLMTIHDLSKKVSFDISGEFVHNVGAVMLALLVIFNSGAVYALADNPVSSGIRWDMDPTSVAYTDSEVEAAEWVHNQQLKSPDSKIYADWYSWYLFNERYSIEERFEVFDRLKNRAGEIKIDYSSERYIMVQHSAIRKSGDRPSRVYINSTRYKQLEDNHNRVYEGGNVTILYGG